MELIHTEHFTVSQMHTDRFERLTPAALLYFAQEAAGAHCTLLGVDQPFLASKGLFWALSRVKAEITRLPRLGETVTVKTRPMPTTRVAYPRAVVAEDENGNVLFRVVSLWVLMDIVTRAMILPGQSGVEVAGQLTGNELTVPRAVALQTAQNHTTRTVGFTLLDRNGHMNNTRYMDWVCDLLHSDFYETHTMRGFTVCYLNEAREQDTLSLDFDVSNDGILTVGAHKKDRDEEKRIFAAQVFFDSFL